MGNSNCFDDYIANLRKPSSMFLDSNWTFQRLLNILKSAIDSSYNISVWATDISYLTTELTECKELELYILGLETIEDVSVIKTMLQSIKTAVELDFPDTEFICKRKLNHAAYELFTTNKTFSQEPMDYVVKIKPDEPFAIALPYDYQCVRNPIVFLDKLYAELYDRISLHKGTLKVEDINCIIRQLPYYIP